MFDCRAFGRSETSTEPDLPLQCNQIAFVLYKSPFLLLFPLSLTSVEPTQHMPLTRLKPLRFYFYFLSLLFLCPLLVNHSNVKIIAWLALQYFWLSSCQHSLDPWPLISSLNMYILNVWLLIPTFFCYRLINSLSIEGWIIALSRAPGGDSIWL